MINFQNENINRFLGENNPYAIQKSCKKTYLLNNCARIGIMAISLEVRSTWPRGGSKASKLHSRYTSVAGACQMGKRNVFVILYFIFTLGKESNRGVILSNKGTSSRYFPSHKLNLFWISTFLLKKNKNISRWLEPRSWNMVPDT